MVDSHVAERGKGGTVHGSYKYIHKVTPDVMSQLAWILQPAHIEKMVLQTVCNLWYKVRWIFKH